MISEKIESRLIAFKFATALTYAEADSDLTNNERDLIHSLAMAFGNSGHFGGVMSEVVGAAVDYLLRRQDWSERLDEFRREVNNRLAVGDLEDYALPAVGAPVLVALSEESMSVVLNRIKSAGGHANLFVEGHDFPIEVNWR